MADDAAKVRQLESELRQARDEIDALRQREAALLVEIERRDATLAASEEQQQASGEILRIIAGSRADLQTVLQAMAERAARLCDAPVVFIHLVRDDRLMRLAGFGFLADAQTAVDRLLNRGYI